MVQAAARACEGRLMENLGIILSAIGLALVIATSVAGVVWKVASLRADFSEQISDLKEKVYKVEIWARDEFVRKGSFETVVARLEKGMEMMATKVETAVEKMASRIETINHHDRA
jgi:hypothetical protein